MRKEKLERMRDSLPGEELLRKPITRRGLLAGAGATSFALLLAACGGNEEAAPPAPPAEPPSEPPPAPPAETGGTDTGVAPTPPSEAPLHEGLADGMYGGPTGFEGAERYQYPLDSEEGRAISALRQLKQDGKAPDKLVIQALDFAQPQFETPWPDTGPSIVQLFEEETGIKIEF